MSDCFTIQDRLVSTWEVYPRIFYFRGRFMDLHGRFRRTVEPLPKELLDESLMTKLQDLRNLLENKFINIVVISDEKITAEELYVCKDQPQKTHESTHDNKHCLNLIICYAVVDALDDAAVKTVFSLAHRIPQSYLDKNGPSVTHALIMCNTKTPYTKEKKRSFSTTVCAGILAPLTSLKDEDNLDILCLTGTKDLGKCISEMFEQRIVNVFHCILSYLNRFVTDIAQGIQKRQNLLDDHSIIKNVRGLLLNGPLVARRENSSFLTYFKCKLVRVVKCSLVLPMSSKYTVPPWICNRLLHEIKFEDVLSQSLSEKTKGYVRQLERFMRSYEHTAKESTYHKHTPTKDVTTLRYSKGCMLHSIVLLIQRDFEDATFRAENVMSSMEILTNIMRKMKFEVTGYLTQTIVDVRALQISPDTNIPDSLRRDILMIQGVTGLGTLYGRFEIHISIDDLDEARRIEHQLRLLMKRHHFYEPFTIKRVKFK